VSLSRKVFCEVVANFSKLLSELAALDQLEVAHSRCFRVVGQSTPVSSGRIVLLTSFNRRYRPIRPSRWHRHVRYSTLPVTGLAIAIADPLAQAVVLVHFPVGQYQSLPVGKTV